MKAPRLFIFILLLSCCCGNLTLIAAPRTLDEINEEREQKAEDEKKALKEGCENNSGKACFRFAESFANEDEKLLYFSKACELEYQRGCEEANKIKAAQEAEKARIAEEERVKQKAEKERLAEEEKRKAKAEEERLKKEQRKAEEAKRLKEEQHKVEEKSNHPQSDSQGKMAEQTYHPYKAVGISLIVVGAVVAAGGIAGFHVASDKEVDKYRKMKNFSTAQEAVSEGLSGSEYLSRANKYRDKAKTFQILEITSGAVGGALLVTGIALAAIKKEKPQNLSLSNISFTPSNGGFYASLGFEF